MEATPSEPAAPLPGAGEASAPAVPAPSTPPAAVRALEDVGSPGAFATAESTSGSVITTFSLPEAVNNPVHNMVLQWMASAFSRAGGPVSYLTARFGSTSDRQQLVELLYKTFPPADDIEYLWDKSRMPLTKVDSPAARAHSFNVHIATLAFGKFASIKDDAEIATCLRLTEEYLQDGFISSTEPSTCRSPFNSGVRARASRHRGPNLAH